MAKKGKYDKQHMVNLAQYERQVDLLYEQAIGEAVQLGVSLGDFDHSKPFSFGDYPLAEKKADKLVRWLQKGLTQTIMGGIAKEWALSNEKNDALAKYLLGKDTDRLPDILKRKFYNHNGEAEQAFKERKVKGLDLSDRAWRYTDQFKNEIELGIGLGIRSGRSAADISRDIRLYLQEPDRLFRRVRTGMVDDEGNPIWRLSKAAEMYHPGAGIYRSSYKNARRLAATETNIAYRTADHNRWQQMDFILGQHVLRSNHHTEEYYDMCDELSGKDENDKKGRYPKDFKFTGWHPLCRCFVVPILPTDEQMDEYMDAQLEGKPYKFEGEVTDMPQGFTDYVERNADRIKAAGQRGTLPYFVRDNAKYYPKDILPKNLQVVKLTPKEIAVKQNSDTYRIGNSPDGELKRLKSDLNNKSIERISVATLEKPLTQEQIIKKVSGGDLTEGSCSSVALTYIGNKQGFDVIDFRGGGSCDYFASPSKIKVLSSVFGGTTILGTNDVAAGLDILKKVAIGEECYFVCGRHAAIVRRVTEDKLEYLEMQNRKEKNNVFTKLNKQVLKDRFTAQTRHMEQGVVTEGVTVLIPMKNFATKRDELRELLEYINTPTALQMKGKKGNAK